MILVFLINDNVQKSITNRADSGFRFQRDISIPKDENEPGKWVFLVKPVHSLRYRSKY